MANSIENKSESDKNTKYDEETDFNKIDECLSMLNRLKDASCDKIVNSLLQNYFNDQTLTNFEQYARTEFLMNNNKTEKSQFMKNIIKIMDSIRDKLSK